jgi:hypothetical protein
MKTLERQLRALRFTFAGFVLIIALLLFAFFLAPSSISLVAPTPLSNIVPITPRPDGNLCWDSQQTGSRAWATVRAGPPLMSSGVGYGIADGDISDSTFFGNHTFQVKPAVPLKVNMHVWYPSTIANSTPLTLRYIVLLDETQLSGAIESSAGPFLDVTLQSGGEITLTIGIPALTPGIHELIVVGLTDVNDEPDNLGIIKLADSRTTLIAGETSHLLNRTYRPLSADGSKARGDPWISLMLGQVGGALKAWNWPETLLPVRSGEPFEFTIFAGYEGPTKREGIPGANPENMPFALLAFLDYQQVDVQPGVRLLYAQVPKDTAYARITAQFPPPAFGRHEIVVFRINYPGVPMCVQIGPPDGQMFPFYLEAKRVAIDVHP